MRPQVQTQNPQTFAQDILKTRFKFQEKETWGYYCPQCRSPRQLHYHPRPDTARHYLQITLTSLVFTLATWHWFEWKGVVSFVPFWMLFEIYFRLRQRVDLKCNKCGFDPVLYLVDVQKARKEIETHWRKIFSDKGIPYPGDEVKAQEQETQDNAPQDSSSDQKS